MLRTQQIFCRMTVALVLTFLIHTGYAQPTVSPSSKNREYYHSQVGLWYTVWWDSQERDPVFYQHHWIKETHVKPIKHEYYATGDPVKLEEDFRFSIASGSILDDTNALSNDNGNIAAHIDNMIATLE